jgi:hypothetical protein
MMMNKEVRVHMKVLICVVVVIAAALAVYSQARLSNTAEGYSFVPPKDWKSESGAEGFVLANAAKTIVVAVKAHSYANFQTFMAGANLERDGLTLAAEPSEIMGGHIFRAVRRTPQGTAVIDTCVLISPYGGGIAIVAITDDKNAETSWQTALDIAGSVRFVKPEAGAAATKTQSILSGKHLLYLYTASGYSERKDLILCSSGTFYQTTDMGGFTTNDIDGPSFSARGGKSGVWSIGPNATKLILRFQNGGTVEYQLSRRQASNEIGLNGKRFFVKGQNMCP